MFENFKHEIKNCQDELVDLLSNHWQSFLGNLYSINRVTILFYPIFSWESAQNLNCAVNNS